MTYKSDVVDLLGLGVFIPLIVASVGAIVSTVFMALGYETFLLPKAMSIFAIWLLVAWISIFSFWKLRKDTAVNGKVESAAIIDKIITARGINIVVTDIGGGKQRIWVPDSIFRKYILECM